MPKWLDPFVERLRVNKRDVTVFVLSFLLAFGIWLLYNMNQSYSATLQSRVYVRSNLPGYFPKSSDPVTVEARCRATGYDMLRSRRRMRSKSVTIQVDPDQLAEEGEGVFVLSANALGAHIGELFGNEVRLESFISPAYAFRFPQENHKTVPVIPVSYLTFRPQYMLRDRLRLQPDSVIVYGEPAYLENVERIYTHKISAGNLRASKVGNVSLDVPRGVRLSDSEVGYTIDVTRYVELKKNVTLSVRNAPAGKELSIFPSSAEVSFRCVFPMASDRTSEMQFYIDYTDFLYSVSGKCVPRTDGPAPGVINWSVEPEVFECVEVGR
ncbi:MAG: hypothetical protein IJ654_04760 [Bacteroidales bacterium]|nr:hypothetical protein [Bacteroidales bacterium]